MGDVRTFGCFRSETLRLWLFCRCGCDGTIGLNQASSYISKASRDLSLLRLSIINDIEIMRKPVSIAMGNNTKLPIMEIVHSYTGTTGALAQVLVTPFDAYPFVKVIFPLASCLYQFTFI